MKIFNLDRGFGSLLIRGIGKFKQTLVVLKHVYEIKPLP